jgi:hypothetical protein
LLHYDKSYYYAANMTCVKKVARHYYLRHLTTAPKKHLYCCNQCFLQTLV